MGVGVGWLVVISCDKKTNLVQLESYGNFSGWGGGGWLDSVIIKLTQSSRAGARTELGKKRVLL